MGTGGQRESTRPIELSEVCLEACSDLTVAVWTVWPVWTGAPGVMEEKSVSLISVKTVGFNGHLKHVICKFCLLGSSIMETDERIY